MLTTLQQAKKLKELGCKLLTHAYYSFDEKIRFHTGIYDWNTYATENTYAVPTISKALDWLREEKGIVCCVDIAFDSDLQQWNYLGRRASNGNNWTYQTEQFSTHSLAESALLDEIIKHLEK